MNDEKELHMARLLILLYYVTSKGKNPVKGVTKLMKLDFLLRYPKALERGMEYLGLSVDAIEVKNHELNNIESKMIRFKYGPWDPEHRLILAILSAKGLVGISETQDTIILDLTSEGISLADQLITIDILYDYVRRSKIIHTNFSKLSATRLKELMYELVPELKNFKMGEEIVL